MDSDAPRDRAIRLLCFMISSARGLIDEPKLYGPRRLVDGAEMLLELLEALGMQESSLSDLKERIHDGKQLMQRDEAYSRSFLDELMLLATELLMQN